MRHMEASFIMSQCFMHTHTRIWQKSIFSFFATQVSPIWDWNFSQDDRVPGAGPPASSLEGDVDLAEVTGSIVNNDAPYSTFHAVPRHVDDEVDDGVDEENHGFDEGDNVDVYNENDGLWFICEVFVNT